MSLDSGTPIIGLLLSGGLDSGILLGHLLRQGREVQPFYVRSRLAWEEVELWSLRRFLESVQPSRRQLRGLVVLDLPLADVYRDHWSVTGRKIPDAQSPDESVYLPGRNLLLLVKAAVWCQLHGIEQLALGVLGSNPFRDATPAFFEHYQAALSCALGMRLEILRPFAGLSKRGVMELGRDLPLGLTFSCIAPVAGLHCGQCNKCAERKAAFRLVGTDDPTPYATAVSTRS